MTTPPTPDGLLLVDKPAGVSSHDVVLAARRALGERRVGHGGTLDPFATGLLVLLAGRATRLLPYLPGDPKVYEAVIAFGAETDTEDFLGAVIRSATLPSRDAVMAAVPSLTGDISHVPPAYSAKHVDGRRAYARARDGQTVTLDAVDIRVDQWEMLGWAGEAGGAAGCTVRVTCGGGTYVRSLARDLGRLCGSAAHLTALRRTRSGPFDVMNAATLEDLRAGTFQLRPALDALPHLPRQALSRGDVHAVASGKQVPASVDGAEAALVNGDNGVLVALAERAGDSWQPRVVMRPAGDVGVDA
jgi:tRNA pseudouridine55 synthase